MSTKTVLLVDDDADFVQATKDLLELHGYSVLTASCGKSALELATAHSPDMMILDVMMRSDTEGIDTCRKIKATPALSGLPVIMLTGVRRAMNLPFGLEPDSERLPVRAVLEKPVPPSRLLEEIERQLADA